MYVGFQVNKDTEKNAETKAVIRSFDNKFLGFAAAQKELYDNHKVQKSPLALDLTKAKLWGDTLIKDLEKLAKNYDNKLKDSITSHLSEFKREESTTSLSEDDVLEKYRGVTDDLAHW